ncbi:MAG: Mor transcription activator family protein [Burkholderiaceae bacterium]|nr:Mor transcription activator family protein [Burkholderiaceae bacterium]
MKNPTAADTVFDFPEGYPDVLEAMAQAAAQVLFGRGEPRELAQATALEITERIRTTVGGTSTYIPRGQDFELSLRDKEIYKQFNGRNYFELAQRYMLTEMQIRNIVKVSLKRDQAQRQFTLAGLD